MASGKLVPAKARLLLTSTTATATASTAAITFPSDWVGGKFLFFTSAASGTSPTLDWAISTTYDDGTNWAVCWRTAQITTTTNYEIQTYFACPVDGGTAYQAGRAALATTGGVISLPTPITDKIRLTYTIGGTNPSFTFAVYFIPWRLMSDGAGGI